MPSQQDVATFVSITGQGKAEALSALGNAGSLQAATERYFLLHRPVSAGSLLQPGDYVKLTTAALARSVSEGPLKAGPSLSDLTPP